MKTYKTKDFYFSCVLLSNGIDLVNSEKDRCKNTVFFLFDITNKEELKNILLDNFVNQKCLVDVKKFTWAIKILKNEIYKHK